jgi:hypothetical protein
MNTRERFEGIWKIYADGVMTDDAMRAVLSHWIGPAIAEKVATGWSALRFAIERIEAIERGDMTLDIFEILCWDEADDERARGERE